MSSSLVCRPAPWLVVGLILGLGLGAFVPHAPLHATATDHTDNFILATGLVDNQLEAVFILDSLTGTLRCAALSTATGKFTSAFEASVLDDLGVKANQNPKFMMVTGTVQLRQPGGNFQLGQSVAYIAETTTGRVAAYAVPWSGGLANSYTPFKGQLYRLDVLQFRTAAVRGQ